MPVLDDCHPQVVKALQKAGLSVNALPYVLRFNRRRRVMIDIEAQRAGQTVLLMEVKCFPDTSAETTELYVAIGQYLVYRGLLKERNIQLPLFLAVPFHAYSGVFQLMAMPAIRENNIKIVVIDMVKEEIVEWLP